MLKITRAHMHDYLSNHIKNYAAGIITKRELVDTFVSRLIEFDFVDVSESFADELPDDVAVELAAFLAKVRAQNYDWRPYLIGVPADAPRTSYRDGLARLDRRLSPVLHDRLGLPDYDDFVVPVTADSHSDA